MQWIYIYYIAVNIIALAMYGADKFFAQNNMWRIPEKTLIGIAAIGGAFGAFIGMEVFRHKTKHLKFIILVPVFMAVHIGIYVLTHSV